MSEMYQIYRLKSESISAEFFPGLKKKKRNIKPFYDHIEKSIDVYDSQLGDIYAIFGIYFLLTRKNQEIIQQEDVFIDLRKRIIVTEDVMEDVNISKELRNSGTLVVDDDNRFSTGSGNRIVFDSRGLHISRDPESRWFENNFKSDVEKSVCCYLLSLAYHQKSQELLLQATSAFDSGKSEEMIAVRDAIFAFDLKYFFENPVRLEVFETRALWEMTARNGAIKQTHDEIKIQVAELANIIEARRRDEEDQRRYEEEQRRQRRERWLTILGVILAAAGLVSVANDAKDLFGL